MRNRTIHSVTRIGRTWLRHSCTIYILSEVVTILKGSPVRFKLDTTVLTFVAITYSLLVLFLEYSFIPFKDDATYQHVCVLATTKRVELVILEKMILFTTPGR